MRGNADSELLPAAAHALAEEVAKLVAAYPGAHLAATRSVITVAGESGSGKSVTALCLAHALTANGIPADVLHQDDYFHRPPATNHAHRVSDLSTVGPQEVDFARLLRDVDSFRAAENGVIVPSVDYAADRFITQSRDFAGVHALIVEGTYVIARVPADLRIFLAATSDDTRERRRARNRDIDAPVVDQVLAIEHDIISQQAAAADVVIDREFRIAHPAR